MRMLNILLPLVTLAVCAESHPATPYRSGGAQKRNEPRSEESNPLMTPQEGPSGHGSPSSPSIISKQPKVGPSAHGMQAHPQDSSMLAKTIEKTEETCVLIGFACCLAFLPSTASMVASGITVGSVPPKTCDCRNAVSLGIFIYPYLTWSIPRERNVNSHFAMLSTYLYEFSRSHTEMLFSLLA
ncbi:hypothetical protein F5880DRAFT_96048 [Lentinula raphanica]|nr:hypothetical protein F5880DRAFT_96048 [Lentinula raphanica]